MFLLISFWKYIYIILQRLKVIKKSQNSKNQGFSYYFLLYDGRIWIRTDNDGSGSGRPKTYETGSKTLLISSTNYMVGMCNAAMMMAVTRRGSSRGRHASPLRLRRRSRSRYFFVRLIVWFLFPWAQTLAWLLIGCVLSAFKNFGMMVDWLVPVRWFPKWVLCPNL
jgi:hypothetical protein